MTTPDEHPFIAFAVAHADIGSLREVLLNWTTRGLENLPRDDDECAAVVETAVAAYLDAQTPAADPDGQTCRAIDVDGEPVSYRGADEPLSERAREALTTVVRAARRLHDEEHADDPPALAVVADAVHAQMTRRGLRGGQLAGELGLRHSVVVRLMQHSDTLTVRELTALARWAGLDVAAVPRASRGTGPPLTASEGITP